MSTLRRILALMFVSLVVPFSLFVTTAYVMGKRSSEQRAVEQMRHINALKQRSIDATVSLWRKELTQMAALPIVRDNVLGVVRQEGAATAKVDEFLQNFVGVRDIESVMLLSKTGTIVYSSASFEQALVGSPATGELEESFRSGQEGNNTFRFYQDTTHGTPHVSGYLSRPVDSTSGERLGVVVFHVPVGETLLAETRNVEGLLTTGETYLVQRSQNDHVYVSALRHDAAQPMEKRVAGGDEAEKLNALALDGLVGEGRAKDYRGVDVFAAWSPVISDSFALVTKVDVTEADAPLSWIRTIVVVLAVLLVVIGLIEVYYILKRYVLEPLWHLESAAAGMTRDDYTKKIPHRLLFSQDDFGRLATYLHQIQEKHRYHHHTAEPEDSDLTHRRG